MVASVVGHLSFNYPSLLTYLKTKSVAIFSGVLVCILILLYGVAINNKVPESIAKPLDSLAKEAESHE